MISRILTMISRVSYSSELVMKFTQMTYVYSSSDFDE